MPGDEQDRFYRRRFFHNWISYAGATLAVLALVCFVFLLILENFGGALNAPYAALVVFILTPLFLIAGLVLIPLGMVVEWMRSKRHLPPSIATYPTIDLNRPRDRRVLAFVGLATLLLVFMSVFGSYKTYQYTESDAFCGRLCHAEMEPEFVSHRFSPHARVKCVECHVGPGASGFLQSKLRGTVQLYEVATDTVPRPIPSPINILRPKRYTCMHCHWPAKFFGSEQLQTVHFLPDRDNTRWDITLLLKVGGAGPWNPRAEGIHWHVGPDTRIDYIATADNLQKIPWVRYTNLKTGKSVVFAAPGAPAPARLKEFRIRTMDCMDCHDRPTHIFRSPTFLMNNAMAAGYVDPSLPDVKREGVRLLSANYASTAQADRAIASGLESYYRKNYPQVAEQKDRAIARAVRKLQVLFRRNFFPYMKVRWNTYSDNIGHMNSPGCFRCHDGLHKSADGQMISKDCDTCHTIVAQGSPGKMTYASQPAGLPFKHPVDIGGAWKMMACDKCHTGAAP